MAHHKLILDDYSKDDFSLIAIHCSEEVYKMAYLLNRHVSLRLARERLDLEFSDKGLELTFPLYEFENQIGYTTYNLIANKCRSSAVNTNSSGSLFGNIIAEKTSLHYLIPEFRKVDYFLKIHSDFETIPLRKLISDINEIKQVISAYSLDLHKIKSRNNLIFD